MRAPPNVRLKRHICCARRGKTVLGSACPVLMRAPHLMASPRASTAAAALPGSSVVHSQRAKRCNGIRLCYKFAIKDLPPGLGTGCLSLQWSGRTSARGTEWKHFPHVAVRTLVCSVAPVSAQQLGGLLPASDCADQRVDAGAGEHGSQQTTTASTSARRPAEKCVSAGATKLCSIDWAAGR